MLAMAVLMGMAREIWEFVSEVTTFPSLQLEHMVIRALFTSSEMKELVSKLFLMSLEKIS
jgi:hypothetical protein